VEQEEKGGGEGRRGRRRRDEGEVEMRERERESERERDERQRWIERINALQGFVNSKRVFSVRCPPHTVNNTTIQHETFSFSIYIK
jgi:hypothetical protein